MSSEMNGTSVFELICCLKSLSPETKILEVTRSGDRVTDILGVGFTEGRFTNRRLTVTIEMPDIPWREDTAIG